MSNIENNNIENSKTENNIIVKSDEVKITDTIKEEKILLDTHILIWYAEGIKLSPYQIELIESARKRAELYISAISIWEITMLTNQGKVIFSINTNEWIDKLLSIPGLNLIDLTIPILMQSCELPNYQYEDYADRMIIATGRVNNISLMTCDNKLIDYGKQGYLRLINPEQL